MATNEESIQRDDFFRMVLVALKSARKNTSLEPYLLYDGKRVGRLDMLEDMGVRIFFHSSPISSQIKRYIEDNYDPDDASRLTRVRQGAYLRYEIPYLLRERGDSDPCVLYTDCDVVFLREVSLDEFMPKFIAMRGRKEGGRTRWRIGGFWHYNSGVILFNVEKMLALRDRFYEFVTSNGGGKKRPPNRLMKKNLYMSDQAAINLFMGRKIQKLPREYNWHPSAGINEQVVIVHFNGLKWTQWGDFLGGKLSEYHMNHFGRLVSKNPESYEYYVQKAMAFE